LSSKICCLLKSSVITLLVQDIESISPLVIDELIRCLVRLRLDCLVPVSLLIFTCHNALGGLPSTITNGSIHQVELKQSSLSFPSAIIGKSLICYLEGPLSGATLFITYIYSRITSHFLPCSRDIYG